uniref:Uncharacterized protein n=1 Tax=Rhizophora mucronata TaxID=61149 RepID=A0A2P2R250_RHIMU
MTMREAPNQISHVQAKMELDGPFLLLFWFSIV